MKTSNQDELTKLIKQLPEPDCLASAWILAELACICRDKLSRSIKRESFWAEVDDLGVMRLERFLSKAQHGISNAANDLHSLSESRDN